MKIFGDIAEETRIGQLLSRMLLAIQYPGWLDRTANQIRAQITGSVTTVTTVTTLTGQTNIGSYSWDMATKVNTMNAWSNVQRRTIT